MRGARAVHRWRRSGGLALVLGLVLIAGQCLGSTALASGGWQWPVPGPVLRGFDPPEDPYGPGHRGIDIVTVVGTSVASVAAGIVTFAGPVGGDLFVTVDHGSGLVSTYSWLSSVLVHKGDAVAAGDVVARSGPGHPGLSPPHLHLGAKLDGAYVDPLALLEPPDLGRLIYLAPLPILAA